ncbi:AAA family ATPase [Blautia sp.]|uniref:AAA family ATPase n=1 Tax=Blautia sp. TaxID=1955243 RepID=UPI002E782E98|nr:AAA family ATPase [Blautia sp.]MEE0811048.1 AAA family ATPase [Blautia sp.]
MVKEKKRLPVGLENFEQIINDNYYYVDKTELISELIRNGGMVNLFTRPRRFGKTLNMSMLEHFFSIERDQSIFEGLKISKDTKLCEEYMGKYPVISISLKGINAATYEAAFDFAVRIMKKVARNVQFLLGSDALSDYDKLEYKELLNNNMSEAAFCGGLKILSELLEKHYGTKVVLLIDEYDVPLAKAFENGYYNQMIFLIRSLLEQALKTNNSLKFAVMTGCMRISKESIFTGLNNLKVLSITDERYDEYFGFTDTEVREMLKYYEIEDHYEEVKNWYDGYQFGSVEVYCPWDVLNYCDKLKDHGDSFPENYWINTSSNDAVRKFIQMSGNLKTKREIETLLAGEEIIKEIHQELVYPEMYQSLENVWSLLFMTGYLTQRGRVDAKRYKLAIPNLEIRDIFETQIMEYFKESVAKDGDTLSRFCDALKNGEETKVGEIFESYLKKTISIRDTFVRKASKENFYHGILLGILGVKEEWYVSSNQESGEGYSDIMVETENSETVILIEVKYANDGNLDQACERALQQIEEKKYDEELRENGVDKILKYGIACYRKHCKVKQAEE